MYVNYNKLQELAQNEILINTMPFNEQHCLIKGTLNAHDEIQQIQQLQDADAIDMPIIIYGRNCTDTSVDAKYKQLVKMRFFNVSIYRGGMFEWTLLQEIYGTENFPTTVPIRTPLDWSGEPHTATTDKEQSLSIWKALTFFS
jgi:Rhodanese-like domain